MQIIILFLFLANAKSEINGWKFIESHCLKEMSAEHAKGKDICVCLEKNLKRRMTPELLQVLVKIYSGKSIEKDMDKIEGATVVTTFETDIKKECKKNTNYDVGPDKN